MLKSGQRLKISKSRVSRYYQLPEGDYTVYRQRPCNIHIHCCLYYLRSIAEIDTPLHTICHKNLHDHNTITSCNIKLR